MTPTFVKQLFHEAPDFHHWLFGTYDFTQVIPSQNNIPQQDFLTSINQYLEKLIWQYENWQQVKNSDEEFLLEVMGRANLHDYYVNLYCTDEYGDILLLDNNGSDSFR